MLQFIFGLPRSGKTELVFEKIKELSLQNKKSILIVPEQSSFEIEKRALNTLGNNFSQNLKVLSFSRLFDEVCRNRGGLSAKILSDTEKVIFMSKALNQISSELVIWGKYLHSITFSKTILDTVGEFKINSINPQMLRDAINLTDSQSLKNKLHDLAIIYEQYDLLIAERFLDPADSLTKLFDILESYNYFKEKNVFIDGFAGFTGQQYNIIDRALTQADDVYVTFTNDTSSTKEYDLFTNIRSAVLQIEKIANSHNVKITQSVFLDKSFYKTESIDKVRKLLYNQAIEPINDENVVICKAKTIFDEAEFVARNIRKLVRTQNYRFKDFAIITRDTDKYAQAIEYACLKNKVNCFFDKKIPLVSFPLSTAALSAIKALDYSTENILRFHKSGIGILSNDEISTLENYTLIWNLNGKIWLNEWDMDVRGFVIDEPNAKNKKYISEINRIREKAINPLIKFKNSFKDNAKNMATAIMNLFEESNANTTLKNICNDFSNDLFTSDFLKKGYDDFLNILDSLVMCYGNQRLSKTEFYDALNLALTRHEIGLIPQTVDQVIFGQADHIYTSNPKIVFVLGANQGVFPKSMNNSGVFAIKERKKLINLGLEIEDNEIFSSIDENYLVYCNLCSPFEKLYISYATQTLKGEALTPSSFVLTLLEDLKPKTLEEPISTFSQENMPETQLSAFSEFCRRLHNNDNSYELGKVLGSDADNLIDIISNNTKTISKESALNLYGNDISMSATKFDTFNRCKFSFFCKYGLRLQKLQPADFNVLQRGTIVHYVLERIISTYKEKIKDFSKEKCDSLCDFYINEYLGSVVGYNSIKNARYDFLISKISRSLKEVVFQIAKEFAQSDFVPTHCELKIGGKDGLPLTFDYDNGKVIFTGSIDRVDEYNGYIRIIDYKTGSKSFKLPDTLFGLNLQMLIYLYAVIRGQNLPDENAAGILYMPSKRDLNNEGMAMNGLLQADISLLKAMEKENNGEFVPSLSINKDGTISKTATSFIKPEEFGMIFTHIENLVKKTANSISNGDIAVKPIDGRDSTACAYCDFKGVCNFQDEIPFKVPNLKNSEVFEILVKGDNNGI